MMIDRYTRGKALEGERDAHTGRCPTEWGSLPKRALALAIRLSADHRPVVDGAVHHLSANVSQLPLAGDALPQRSPAGGKEKSV